MVEESRLNLDHEANKNESLSEDSQKWYCYHANPRMTCLEQAMTETTHTEPASTPIKTLAEHIRDAFAGKTLLDFATLKKTLKAVGVPLTGKKKISDDTIRDTVRQLAETGELYEHPPKKSGGATRYATFRPKTVEELEAEKAAVVEAKRKEKEEKKAATAEAKRKEKEEKAASEQRQKTLDAYEKLGEAPVTESKLAKPKANAGPMALAAYEVVLRELLDTGKLFKHGEKYGKLAPKVPCWYETPLYKTPFAKLLKAGADVLKVDVQPAAVVFGELLARLNVTLGQIEGRSDGDLAAAIVSFVDRWADEYKVGCPFDKLYEHLATNGTPPTIGRFHDLLRELDRTRRIRLSGWAKTLYDLPRGELALLISDKVFYYANPASWGG